MAESLSESELEQELARLERQHQHRRYNLDTKLDTCVCGRPWPCPTLRLVAEVWRLRAALDAAWGFALFPDPETVALVEAALKRGDGGERMDMDQTARELGFRNAGEMFKLVSAVDLSEPEKLAAFTAWKNDDGTKAGLLQAFPELARGDGDG